jgi:hypothetical protein
VCVGKTICDGNRAKITKKILVITDEQLYCNTIL